MSNIKDSDPFETIEDEKVEDVFEEKEEKFTKKCPSCGMDVESDAAYCPFCGSKLNEQENAKDEVFEEKKGPIKPRPLAKGEVVEKSPTKVKEYKYGDGHSASALSIFTLVFCWAFPILALISSLLGVHSKNPKDVKLFKISAVLSAIFLIIHIVAIALGYADIIDID